jgi:hypothetical protein
MSYFWLQRKKKISRGKKIRKKLRMLLQLLHVSTLKILSCCASLKSWHELRLSHLLNKNGTFKKLRIQNTEIEIYLRIKKEN